MPEEMLTFRKLSLTKREWSNVAGMTLDTFLSKLKIYSNNRNNLHSLLFNHSISDLDLDYPDDSYIRTNWLAKFYPLSPRINDIYINDIAHGLSCETRFCGQGGFYSVAQHSVEVSKLFKNKRLALYALLHDASEAYLKDVPAPIKHTPVFSEYLKAENLLQSLILIRFGLDAKLPKVIKNADKKCLSVEFNNLFIKHKRGWSSDDAFSIFYDRFMELTDDDI